MTVIFDAIHLVSARSANAELLLTFNPGDFGRIAEPDDPRILVPPDPPGLPRAE